MGAGAWRVAPEGVRGHRHSEPHQIATVVENAGSHAVYVSQAEAVAALIEQAVSSTVAAVR
jgi:hypothetical protein